MYPVTAKWKEETEQTLRNPSYVRIVFGVTDPDAPGLSTQTDNGHLPYSDVDSVDVGTTAPSTYQTLERNRFILDGKNPLPPESNPIYQGYAGLTISGDAGTYTVQPLVKISFGDYVQFPGLTFQFDDSMGDYPNSFRILAKKDSVSVFDKTYSPDTTYWEMEDQIPLCNELSFYWLNSNIPHRRARLLSLTYGLVSRLGSDDIASCSSTKEIDLLSSKIPKQEFEFTLIDTQRRYDPENPSGLWEYLESRQPVNYQYGYELLDGSIEWIPWGLSYSTGDFDVSKSGIVAEVSVKCAGLADHLTMTYDEGVYSAAGRSLFDLATDVMKFAGFENTIELDNALKTIYTHNPLPSSKVNECLQLIANAGRCIMNHSRGGYIQILRENDSATGFDINFDKMTDTPTTTKIPPLRNLSVEYNSIKVDSVENETDRFKRLCALVKQKYGKERIIYVLDEVGQYVAASEDLIRSMQGTMQILKSQFKGNVWLIATAQQTLTEDNPQAQVNSDKLFKLNDRFPIKVDIEADDIKEIITKRLLGKSPKGKEYLTDLFNRNEASIKLETRLTNMERSLYMKPLTGELFANLYPFLPVHIDILLALLQKLASRSGGSGLRSVIRLIRDLLVDGHLADCAIGKMATPDLFYDTLHTYMEKNQDFREIVISAKKAIELYSSNPLAVKACKTIAIMQLLDDFCLSFDNLCSLLFQQVGHPLNKPELRALLDEIKDTPGVTLQEIDGRFRFMTNAILTVQDERSRLNATDSEKFKVMKELVLDILSPAPSVSIYGSKTINATVELCRGRQNPVLISGGDIKINVRFVDASDFEKTHNALLTESTKVENKQTMFWLCTLPQDIELLLIDVVRDETICNNHRHDINKEIQDYLRAQQADAEKNRQEITRILRQSQNNSETICKGSPTSVNGETYKTQALKKFAEDVYDKYPLASRSMPTSVVSDLLAYDDATKLPASLNPFEIVDDNGVIDTSYAAFAEIKDYIASHNDANGGQLADSFSRAKYGWSKDTIRYLVALMLKAGMIVVRSGAQSFKMFTKNAAEAMKNNTSFSHLGLSLNTDAHLSPAEMMEAMKMLKELYNPQGLTPIPASIAKAALKIATQRRTKVEQLKETFEKLEMAGTGTISQAVNYLVKIIDSEGAEAPYLFAKDKACADALRYVNQVQKAEEQGKMLSSIKKIEKRLSDAQRLPQLPTLEDLKNKLGEDEQAFNDIMLDPAALSILPGVGMMICPDKSMEYEHRESSIKIRYFI